MLRLWSGKFIKWSSCLITILSPMPIVRRQYRSGSICCIARERRPDEQRVVGTAAAIALLWQLIKPLERSEAYKLGIIDRHGKLLRSPETAEERNAYNPLVPEGILVPSIHTGRAIGLEQIQLTTSGGVAFDDIAGGTVSRRDTIGDSGTDRNRCCS
jgi:hypothetical protein